MRPILTLLFSLLLIFGKLHAQPAPGVILLHFEGYISEEPIVGYQVFYPSGLNILDQRFVISHVERNFSKWNIIVTTNDSIAYTYPKNKRMEVIVTMNWLYNRAGFGLLNALDSTNPEPAVVNPWATAMTPISIGNAITHEVGHLMGLAHQCKWDKDRLIKYNEYDPGNIFFAPLMGNFYYTWMAIWWKGYNTFGQWQDDEAEISKRFSPKYPIPPANRHYFPLDQPFIGIF